MCNIEVTFYFFKFVFEFSNFYDKKHNQTNEQTNIYVTLVLGIRYF